MTEIPITTIQQTDQLPIVPEIDLIEPLVQCGVLYLGSAPSNNGFHGLDAIQEPFSYRYPVDGTNTVRGIDAVLSIYDNGIQLVFTRQPHAAVFFPITSLIYCSSLRFTVIENDYTKSTPMIDWRFMPLDTYVINESKHPPLFSVIIQRTQIMPGDECHCFITKNVDAAFSLVQAISQAYANINPESKCLKSPIFYQLDRYGRKLSEIHGIIYISPANDDDLYLNRTNPNRLTDESTIRNYLFDPTFGGFFYRTDASIVEQWQLWDDDDKFVESRPRPPASPFGLHEGLYHDDTSHEIQRYLRHMDDEEPSCSCSCSSKSSTSASSSSSSSNSVSSTPTEHSRQHSRHYYDKQQLINDIDQFDTSFANLQTSSFEPISIQNNNEINETKKAPIIIEKVIPKLTSSIPILNPILPQQPLNIPNPVQEPITNSLSQTELPSFSYRINEHGEKITKEGNRILFMDVVQLETNKNQINTQSYQSSTSRSRSRPQRLSKQVPTIDNKRYQRLYDENKSKTQRYRYIDDKPQDHSNNTKRLTTPNTFEIVDGYFEDRNGRQIKLNNHQAQLMLNHFESSNIKKQERKINTISSINSSKHQAHHRRSKSTITTGPSVNYVERPSIPSSSSTYKSSIVKQKPPTPPVLTHEKLNELVSNIYGTTRSVKPNSSSINHQERNSSISTTTTVINPTYISAFRYMKSSVNPKFLQEYRDAY
ncbi:unnamed protein product [Rotaria sp. Silwood1]|nr:unnamed protein product [Rotaria sp. Silwood1]CAF1069763.1 unnamed protein product [Rotaria sp. Silwood1]CAF3400761.1 unnamed protein product [Rotaria sp. Silwood1]CAF4694352.1 unnamed protein product [Rotaria sp. Silwood1]